MGKIRKQGNKFYCEIPENVIRTLGLQENDEIEFLNVYKDLFVVVPKKSGLSDQEIKILQKIGKIRYDKRTRDTVHKLLSDKERDIFEDLKKREIIFEYRKNGRELYGISKNYFKYVVGEKRNTKEDTKFSHKIIQNEEEFQRFAREFEDSIKAGEIRVLKGFDKKYYAINTSVLNDVKGKILECIKTTEKPVERIAKETGLEGDLCKCAIEILKEEGVVFEKSKGWYKSVGNGD